MKQLNSEKTEIYCDGSCSKKGIGGWGVVIVKEGKIVNEYSGRNKKTTNNRMELQAAIQSLKSLSKDERVVIYSDSQYVINGICKWIHIWQKRKWKTTKGMSVLNRDLWEQLYLLNKLLRPQWQWIRGHIGNIFHDRADELGRVNEPKPLESNIKISDKKLEKLAIILNEDKGYLQRFKIYTPKKYYLNRR